MLARCSRSGRPLSVSVPATFALALVPATAVSVLDTRSGRGLALPVLALSGLLAIHVTEVLVVGALVLGALVFARSTLSVRVRQGGWVLVVMVLTSVLMWPFPRRAAESGFTPAARWWVERPRDLGSVLGHHLDHPRVPASDTASGWSSDSLRALRRGRGRGDHRFGRRCAACLAAPGRPIDGGCHRVGHGCCCGGWRMRRTSGRLLRRGTGAVTGLRARSPCSCPASSAPGSRLCSSTCEIAEDV